MAKNRSQVDFILFCISSVIVKSVYDKVLFLWAEEFAGLSWKVDDDKAPNNAYNTGNCAFDDEDPWGRSEDAATWGENLLPAYSSIH